MTGHLLGLHLENSVFEAELIHTPSKEMRQACCWTREAGQRSGRYVPGAQRRPSQEADLTGLATCGLLEAHAELLELEIGLCESWLLMTGCPVIGTTRTGQPPVRPMSPPCPALAGWYENTGSDQSTPPALPPTEFLPAALTICTSQSTGAPPHAGPRHVLSWDHLALRLAGALHVC